MRGIVFIYLIFLSHVVYYVDCQTSPSERCTSSGERVCTDCRTFGECTSGPDFDVTTLTECPNPDEICDDSVNTDTGTCVAAPIGVCACEGADLCNLDPNNPAALVDCSDPDNPVYLNCIESSLVDMVSCTCLTTTTTTTTLSSSSPPSLSSSSVSSSSSSSSSPLSSPTTSPLSASVTSPTTSPTTSPLSSSSTTSTTTTTTSPLSSSTTTSTTTTTSPTTTENPCNFCGYVDDPDDDCGRYFRCIDGELVPQTCPGITCFDQQACQCVLQPTGRSV